MRFLHWELPHTNNKARLQRKLELVAAKAYYVGREDERRKIPVGTISFGAVVDLALQSSHKGAA